MSIPDKTTFHNHMVWPHDSTMPRVSDLVTNLPTSGSEIFKQHQAQYLGEHGDEITPKQTGPFAVGIVSRAYRELSNGNLTAQLISFATQNIPANQFRAYIAVNNARSFVLASEVWENNKIELETLSDNEQDVRLGELVKIDTPVPSLCSVTGYL